MGEWSVIRINFIRFFIRHDIEELPFPRAPPTRSRERAVTRVAKGRSNRVGSGQKVDPKNQPDFWPFFDLFRPFINDPSPLLRTKNIFNTIKFLKYCTICTCLLSLMSIWCTFFAFGSPFETFGWNTLTLAQTHNVSKVKIIDFFA